MFTYGQRRPLSSPLPGPQFRKQLVVAALVVEVMVQVAVGCLPRLALHMQKGACCLHSFFVPPCGSGPTSSRRMALADWIREAAHHTF